MIRLKLLGGLIILSFLFAIIVFKFREDSRKDRNSSARASTNLSKINGPGSISVSIPKKSFVNAHHISDKASVTNELLITAETRWNQTIPEEPFAKFHDWAEKYLRTSTAHRAVLENEGLALGRARREMLKSLIQTDPERALQLTVPLAVARQLPGFIQSQLEERVGGRGRLAVLGALPEPGKERAVKSTFRTATVGAREFEAFVYGRRLGEPTRENISLHGIAVDQVIAVSDNPLRVLEQDEARETKTQSTDPICAISGQPANEGNEEIAADVGDRIVFLCGRNHAFALNEKLIAQETGGTVSPADTQSSQPSTWTEGQKSLIFMRVDFSDLPGPPFSDSTGINLISNLNAFYLEMSYGRSGFQASGAGSDITPTFRMPQPASWYSSNNKYGQLRIDARNAATAAGYLLTNYDRDVTCMSAVPGWDWSGLGFVGASGAWLRNNFNTGVAAHELGHNHGLNHANFWDTQAQSVAGPGTSVEYGDVYDTMGSASAGPNHFNVRNKAYLNWLKTNEWLNVTSNGTYRLFAQDDPGSTGLRGLRIPKDNLTNYWVEFRQKNQGKWMLNGAGLRMAQDGNQQSQLLDTTPGSLYGKSDACIVLGRTYSDRNAGLHITPIGKGGTVPESLDVVVNLGQFPANQSPLMQLSASTTVAAVGEVVQFTATANDPDGDPVSYFWDFGNSSFGANTSSVTNSWIAEGEYAVRCVVSDLKGGLASQSKIITVGNPSTYRVSGNVTTASGPVQGVRVYISSTKMAYTGSDGSYSIPGVTSGTYNAKASLENYVLTNASFANPIIVGSTLVGIDFSGYYSSSMPPLITTQPLGQTLTQGADAIFSVAAIGTPRIYYQWLFNGVPISGATGIRLIKAAVQPSDAGLYSVLLTNAGGMVQSANAALVVKALPISRPTLSAGSFTSNGQWQFNVIGNPNQQYLIEFSSNLLDWVQDLTLTNVTGTVQYIDSSARSSSKRFYRSRVLQ